MNRLYEIETYWVKKLNIKVEQIKDLEEKTLPVAIFIASYAHKDQRRLNGDYYYDHPEGVLKKAGYTLASSNKYALIIRYAIENKIYDIYEVNKLLEEYGYSDSLII